MPLTALLANSAALIDTCRRLGVPVIHTVQPGTQSPEERGLLTDFWGKGLGDVLEEAAIVDDVVPDASGVLVCTWRYSAFFRSDLDRQLRMLGRDQIVVCGVYAHLGCTTTAVDAFSRNLEVFLAADAVADFSAREHRTALEWAAGCCAAVRTTEELTGLLRSSAAGHLRPASTVLRSGDATVPGHVAATPSRPDEVPRSSTGGTRPATILTCTKTMHERTGR